MMGEDSPNAGSAVDGTGMSRRNVLKICAAACGLYLAAPMISRGRFQVFAQTPTEYSSRTIDLVASSLVIDMLSADGGEGRPKRKMVRTGRVYPRRL